MKTLKVNSEKCVTCNNCILACRFLKSSKDSNLEKSIRICDSLGEEVYTPIFCLHCEEAECLDVCPANAITRDPKTNAVIIQEERCIGCKMCILNCKYGNIYYDADKKKSYKCNLCEGDPKCVGHCISGALNYETKE